MEEVDKILILTLNQLGCDLDEGIRSVADFGIDEVISGVTRCLKTIDGDREIPSSLPQNMAQRFRAAATIAQAIKDTGYPGDVGYQSLLYPNEIDLRKIFMFLIEKLPKDTTAVSDEPINKISMIHREVKQKLARALAQAWIPPHCRTIARSFASQSSVTSYSIHHNSPFISKPYTSVEPPNTKSSQAKKLYYEKYIRRVTRKLGSKYAIPSLLNSHAVQLECDQILPTSNTDKENEVPKLEPWLQRKVSEKSLLTATSEKSLPTVNQDNNQSLLSTFGSYKQMMNTLDSSKEIAGQEKSSTSELSTEEQVARKREEHLSQCQNEVAELTQKIKDSISLVKSSESSFTEINEEIEREEKAKEEKASELKMKQRTASLIPDSEANIQKLQTVIKNSEEKMLRLQQQWESHKQPLDEQFEKLNYDISTKKGNKDQLRTRMAELRDKMRVMVQDAHRKETLLAQLKSQCENMNKDINRSVYTRRIVDISAKVRKQKEEIDRVLADTRMIQKEINTLSGKLERTFTVVEGLAYKEASSNERARQIYRAVAAVHEGCGDLVDITRETGAIQRDISDLKEQVDLEKSKKVEEVMEQLKSDLSQVKKENTALKQQLS